MMKKRLSILLVLIMVLTMLPGNVVTVSAVVDSVAMIGTTEYTTLQAAVTAVTAGQTIMLNSSTNENVTVLKEFDFIINLNGKTLNGGENPAILKQGNGTLNITDTAGNGIVTSSVGTEPYSSISRGTIKVASGSAIITGGTVKNTGPGYAILNLDNCSVNVTGGTVENTTYYNFAIFNAGRLNVSGGTVSSTGFDAIQNCSSGSVNVSGGTVRTAGGSAIVNEGGRVTLTGGTIAGTKGIKNSNSGTISIPSGTVEIIGGSSDPNAYAMNAVPNLSDYTDVQIIERTGGSDAGFTWSSVRTLSVKPITDFKYLKFTSAKITSKLSFTEDTETQTCTGTAIHIAHVHSDGRACWAWNKDSATLTLDGIDLEVSENSNAIDLVGVTNAKLVLKGNNTITLRDGTTVSSSAIHANNLEISGTGTLTVQATGGYKPFTSNPILTGMVHRAGTGTWDNTSGTACTYEPYVAPPANNGGSGGGAPVKKAGKIEKDQKHEGNAPIANLADSIEDLKAKVLSAAEQEQIAAGKDAKVILKVQDISTSVSAEDKKLIEEKLTFGQQNTANPALLYVDISLFKQVGDGQETKVTETSGKLKISIEVPESMWSTEAGVDRTYRVIRIHNGVAEVLEGTYDPATHLFTFETDRFSTYALTYQDGNKAPDLNNGGTSDQLTVIRDFNHLRLTAKADKTSQKLSYAKVAGADGYLIYGAQYGKKLKKLADVKGTVRSYTVKKLKQGTYYTYQVKAYKVVDGKKVIIAESSLIHSVTTSKTYGNPTKINIKKSSITLAAGKTKKVTYQVVLPKNKKMKAFAKPTRFETTNPEIATISKSGKITAKAKGTCDVYVYAQNGVYKKIKVTVK